MQILNAKQISQKVKRLAIEILERNFGESTIILAGINNNGTCFAEMLYKALVGLTDMKIEKTTIRLNPAKPLSAEIEIGIDTKDLKNKVIIVVDDVANTGRTLFYALKPIMEVVPKKVEVAVLVDRTHKAFPINTNYFGMTLATTFQEHIDVQILNVKEEAVFLN